MKKHAAIMKPKFDAMYKVLNEELDGLGIAEWTVAKGGYFASYDTLPGCARAVVEMAAEHGVKFTPQARPTHTETIRRTAISGWLRHSQLSRR